MANSTTGNPWVLDTAGVITKNNIMVEKMVFLPTTANDDLLVKDNAGTAVWATRGIVPSGATYDSIGHVIFDGPLLMNGFNLDTIDAGAFLKVYLR